MPTSTTNYGWSKPVVGADDDLWGGMLNTDLDGIDATVKTVSNTAIGDNRIINGDMRIDARNAGASGTAAGYTVDRWQYVASQPSKGTWGRNLGGYSSSGGFPYWLGFSSSSAYASIATDNFAFQQTIEADMVSDFAWGTANAQPAMLSFWVYSSLSGTFSGAVINQPQPPTRSYPFTFSIPVAGVGTRIVITIPGDTAGTWVMSGNAGGAAIRFDLGAGSNSRGPAGAWASANYVGVTGAVSVVATNSANFYLTGVKLEIGGVATPFNRQSLAKSTIDCQRYWQQGIANFDAYLTASGFGGSHITLGTMRAIPTIVIGGALINADTNVTQVIADTAQINSFRFIVQAAGVTGGTAASRFFSASSEL